MEKLRCQQWHLMAEWWPMLYSDGYKWELRTEIRTFIFLQVLENYSDAPMTPKQILQVIEAEGLKEMRFVWLLLLNVRVLEDMGLTAVR